MNGIQPKQLSHLQELQQWLNNSPNSLVSYIPWEGNHAVDCMAEIALGGDFNFYPHSPSQLYGILQEYLRWL